MEVQILQTVSGAGVKYGFVFANINTNTAYL